MRRSRGTWMTAAAIALVTTPVSGWSAPDIEGRILWSVDTGG